MVGVEHHERRGELFGGGRGGRRFVAFAFTLAASTTSASTRTPTHLHLQAGFLARQLAIAILIELPQLHGRVGNLAHR